jgi:hypothetical protein
MSSVMGADCKKISPITRRDIPARDNSKDMGLSRESGDGYRLRESSSMDQGNVHGTTAAVGEASAHSNVLEQYLSTGLESTPAAEAYETREDLPPGGPVTPFSDLPGTFMADSPFAFSLRSTATTEGHFPFSDNHHKSKSKDGRKIQEQVQQENVKLHEKVIELQGIIKNSLGGMQEKLLQLEKENGEKDQALSLLRRQCMESDKMIASFADVADEKDAVVEEMEAVIVKLRGEATTAEQTMAQSQALMQQAEVRIAALEESNAQLQQKVQSLSGLLQESFDVAEEEVKRNKSLQEWHWQEEQRQLQQNLAAWETRALSSEALNAKWEERWKALLGELKQYDDAHPLEVEKSVDGSLGIMTAWNRLLGEEGYLTESPESWQGVLQQFGVVWREHHDSAAQLEAAFASSTLALRKLDLQAGALTSLEEEIEHYRQQEEIRRNLEKYHHQIEGTVIKLRQFTHVGMESLLPALQHSLNHWQQTQLDETTRWKELESQLQAICESAERQVEAANAAPIVQWEDRAIQTETELPTWRDGLVQTEDLLSSDCFIQTESLLLVHDFVQTDSMASSESAMQTESVEGTRMGTQTEEAPPPQMAEAFIQTEMIETVSENNTQTDAIACSDSSLQTEDVMTTTLGTQWIVEAHSVAVSVVVDMEAKHMETDPVTLVSVGCDTANELDVILNDTWAQTDSLETQSIKQQVTPTKHCTIGVCTGSEGNWREVKGIQTDYTGSLLDDMSVHYEAWHDRSQEDRSTQWIGQAADASEQTAEVVVAHKECGTAEVWTKNKGCGTTPRKLQYHQNMSVHIATATMIHRQLQTLPSSTMQTGTMTSYLTEFCSDKATTALPEVMEMPSQTPKTVICSTSAATQPLPTMVEQSQQLQPHELVGLLTVADVQTEAPVYRDSMVLACVENAVHGTQTQSLARLEDRGTDPETVLQVNSFMQTDFASTIYTYQASQTEKVLTASTSMLTELDMRAALSQTEPLSVSAAAVLTDAVILFDQSLQTVSTTTEPMATQTVTALRDGSTSTPPVTLTECGISTEQQLANKRVGTLPPSLTSTGCGREPVRWEAQGMQTTLGGNVVSALEHATLVEKLSLVRAMLEYEESNVDKLRQIINADELPAIEFSPDGKRKSPNPTHPQPHHSSSRISRGSQSLSPSPIANEMTLLRSQSPIMAQRDCDPQAHTPSTPMRSATQEMTREGEREGERERERERSAALQTLCEAVASEAETLRDVVILRSPPPGQVPLLHHYQEQIATLQQQVSNVDQLWQTRWRVAAAERDLLRRALKQHEKEMSAWPEKYARAQTECQAKETALSMAHASLEEAQQNYTLQHHALEAKYKETLALQVEAVRKTEMEVEQSKRQLQRAMRQREMDKHEHQIVLKELKELRTAQHQWRHAEFASPTLAALPDTQLHQLEDELAARGEELELLLMEVAKFEQDQSEWEQHQCELMQRLGEAEAEISRLKGKAEQGEETSPTAAESNQSRSSSHLASPQGWKIARPTQTPRVVVLTQGIQCGGRGEEA